MIVVTGTKRSGTSMWMQILKAAGFPVLGCAFPRDWGETIREANRAGFYESRLRHGIYHATNPNPRTGAFLAPDETRRHAVKVFAQGLARSELAYLDFVIAAVRDPREYQASLQRLYALEHRNKIARAERCGRTAESVPRLTFAPAWLEWWHDNVTLLLDAVRRSYPIRFVSYAAVLRDPERVVGETLAWLGLRDPVSAAQSVKHALRTQEAPRTAALPHAASGSDAELCAELYQRLDRGQAIDRRFLARLSRAHQQLLPRIQCAEQRARRARQSERARARAAREQKLEP